MHDAFWKACSVSPGKGPPRTSADEREISACNATQKKPCQSSLSILLGTVYSWYVFALLQEEQPALLLHVHGESWQILNFVANPVELVARFYMHCTGNIYGQNSPNAGMSKVCDGSRQVQQGTLHGLLCHVSHNRLRYISERDSADR